MRGPPRCWESARVASPATTSTSSTATATHPPLPAPRAPRTPARHTHPPAPPSMAFGLREALRAVVVEGLEARFERHRLHGAALRAGLAAMGLTLFGPETGDRRLPFITPVVGPAGADELAVRRRPTEGFCIEGR